MLYPTHQKYGILFGILMIPLTILLGFLPTLSIEMRPIDVLIILLACFMGMSGALFGARFPDIDSATSIPARRHPLIRKVFVYFKIAHRGRYSHDYATIGATFLIAYFVVHRGGLSLLHYLAEGHQMTNYVTYGMGLFILVLIGGDIVDFIGWVGTKLGMRQLVASVESKHTLYVLGIAVLGCLLLFLSGAFSPAQILAGQDTTTAILIASIFVIVMKLYVLFAWAGAYSHLFADMTTKQGVHFFGKNLAPAQVILKVKKIPLVGSLLVPTDFRTGSKWEDFNALVVTIACVPAGLLAIMSLFGFNLGWLF